MVLDECAAALLLITRAVRNGLKTRRPKPVISNDGASLRFTLPNKVPGPNGLQPDLDSTLSSDSEDDFSSDDEDI